MITEKTMMTWFAEFNKISNNDPTGAVGMEYLVKIQGEFLRSEPMMAAMVSQLFGALKLDNPLSGAVLALSIFHDCVRRQNESDDLTDHAG